MIVMNLGSSLVFLIIQLGILAIYAGINHLSMFINW